MARTNLSGVKFVERGYGQVAGTAEESFPCRGLCLCHDDDAPCMRLRTVTY